MTNAYSPNVGKQVSAGAEGTYALIGYTYDNGRKHQWAVELWRNPVQAISRVGKPRGNEQVVFDFVPFEFLDANDNVMKTAWKRRVWNDGPPMDPKAELLAYFETITKGAGTNRRTRQNLGGQYGQGSRASVLPHSHMFVATTQPGGLTHAICIVDTGMGTYGLMNFTFDARQTVDILGQFDDDCYMTVENGWQLWLVTKELIHPTVIKNGGITTILCGPEMLDHYLDGDPHKGESARTLVMDLTKWLNGPLPVSVDYVFERTKGVVPTGRTLPIDGVPHRVETRNLKSYKDWFDRVPADLQTCIQIDDAGTVMDVYLLPEDWNWDGPFTQQQINNRQTAAKKAKKTLKIHEPNPGQFFIEAEAKDAWLPWSGEGFLVYSYDYEMLPVYDQVKNNVVSWMKNWGVNVADVARRCAFVITPPKLDSVASGNWGVMQSISRASITGPNESGLPVDEWISTFYDMLQNDPDLEFLRKALEQAPKHTKHLDTDTLKRIQSDVNGRLDALNPTVAYVKTKKNTGKLGLEDGETEVSPEHGGGKRRQRAKSKRKQVTPDPQGTVNYEERKIDNMPDYEFLTEDEWKDKLLEGDTNYHPDAFVVVERSVGTTLYFNMGHEIYQGERTYFTSTWWIETGRTAQLRKVQLGDVEECVKMQYAEEGVSKVYYADRVARRGRTHVDMTLFKHLTDSETLTIAMGGWVNVDKGIIDKISKL